MDKNSTLKQEAALPTTCPTVLERLASNANTQVRRLIACNPNTPKEILFQLGKDFPKEIVNNPVLDFLLLENPYLITEMPYETVVSLLKLDPKFKFWTIETVSKHHDWLKIFEELDGIEIPINSLIKFAHSPNSEVRLWVTKNSNIPIDIIVKLATDKDAFVRQSAASNPNIPIHFIEILSTGDKYVREGVAKNPSTPVDILEILSQDTIFTVRASVAKNRNTSATILQALSHNFQDILKCFLEENYFNLMNKLPKLNFQTEGLSDSQSRLMKLSLLWFNFLHFCQYLIVHNNVPVNIKEEFIDIICIQNNLIQNDTVLEILSRVRENN